MTRAQALASGFSPSTIDRRIRAGRWTRVLRGIYRIGPLRDPRGWASAAVLAGGSRARLSHLAAARLWDWVDRDPAGTDADPIDLIVEGDHRGIRPGLRVHRVRALHDDERATRHGFPVTGAGRTLVDAAAILPLRGVEGLLGRARRSGEIDDEDLHALPARYRRRPGVGALKAVLSHGGALPFTRSEAEGRFLELVRKAGLSMPRVNALLGPYELDFVWSRERLVVEIDGYEYHRSRDRFEGDRRKGAWLQARGYRVVRLTWSQITTEAVRTIVQVGQALAGQASVGDGPPRFSSGRAPRRSGG